MIRNSVLVFVALLVTPMLMASTCGGDETPEYVSAFCLSNPGMDCTVDLDCGDHVFCNGIERCMPGAAGADGCGCMRVEPATPCMANQVCNEAAQRCEACRTDADGDGRISMACGGDDCDEGDPNRFPGNPEVCDALGHDEDCDALTFGEVDADGDQFFDAQCCNTETGGAMHCGNDCDDTNAAIVPGAQKCQKGSSTGVEICLISGQWSTPQACNNTGTCTVQPNGLGVCN